MKARDAVLVHQVHPVKLGADIGAAVVSLPLIWRGYRRAGTVVHFAPAFIGSAAVLAFADLDRLAQTRRGRYVLAHMPPAAQAVRAAGDAVMVWGARRHRPGLVAAGLAVVVVGWSHGLLDAARTGLRRRRVG